MSYWLKQFYDFPLHHQSAAWWIAMLFAVGPFRRFLRSLPIWGAKFRRHQRAIQIRTLERLHEDTNRLILYLLRDALEVALDFCWQCFGFVIIAMFTKVSIEPRIIAVFVLMFASALVGNVFRLRILVANLMNYDEALAALKARQTADV